MHSNVDILRAIEQPTRQAATHSAKAVRSRQAMPEVTHGTWALESTSQKVHVG
jgi:hypothetical protein